MQRILLVIALALSVFVGTTQPALAAPGTPPPWGSVILCIQGYHAVTHPLFAEWGSLGRCVPDHQ
jgi:hypothetical protein